MGSMGSIGSVNATFEANTSNLTAGLELVGKRLADTGAKAQAAGRIIDNSISRVSRTFDKTTEAGARLGAMMDRQNRAAGLAADADSRLARAKELAALRTDLMARANENLGASTTGVAAKFRMLSTVVAEASSSMQAHMLETAEAANVEAEGITAGFAGLSTLLGAGLAVGFAAHFADGLAKMNLQLGLVNETTGVSVQELAGLQLKTEELGGSFDQVAMGIARLGRAQQQAKDAMAHNEPLNEYTRAFRELGISMKEVQEDTPEQMLDRVAKAFAETKSSATRTSAAIELFSRSGVKLIPILTEEGANLHANALAAAKLKGITNESVESARRWQYGVADLSAEFRAHLMPVLTYAPDIIMGVVGAFDSVSAVMVEFAEIIARSAIVAVESIKPLAEILGDVSMGNFAAIPGHAHEIQGDFLKQYKAETKDLRDVWHLVQGDFQSKHDGFKAKPFNPLDIPGDDPLAGKARAGRGEHDRVGKFDNVQHLPFSRLTKGKEEEARKAYYKSFEVLPRAAGGEDWNKHDPEFQRKMDKLQQRSQMIATANQRALSLAQINIQEKQGALSPYMGAQARSGVNESAYKEQVDILKESLAKFGDIDFLLTDTQKEQKGQLQNQLEELKGIHKVELAREQAELLSKTWRGAAQQSTSDYLGQFSGANIAGQMAPQTLDTVNSSMAHLMTTGKGDFAGMFRGIGDMGATQGLGALENHFLKGPLSKLLGGKGKLGESQANAMWVKNADKVSAAAAKLGGMDTKISSVTSLLPTGAGAGGVLSTIGGTLMKSLPFIAGFLATGGPVSAGLSYMVGERGPELFTPGSGGRIIPNHKLSQVGGGGGGSTAIHVDARGATDPAATAMAVQRGIMAMGHAAVRQSMHAATEMKARTPR